jgi:Protein of unknown function (DUF2480)
MEEKALVNRVDQSGLVTIDLEKFFPTLPILSFDIKDYLFHGLILKEKDFREALKIHDWSQYKDAILCVYCSTDAIIPVWAFMLVNTYATSQSNEIFTGTVEEYLKFYYRNFIGNLDAQSYQDGKVVIKGCSNKPVPASAYADITTKLSKYAQSIMYGEPCSTVPVFKRPRALQ